MWSRKRLDIRWSDVLAGGVRACFPPDAVVARRKLEESWPGGDGAIACLSVRSGFDLLLEMLSLPRGSEVLVSALTIPDMVRIVEHHGLVPVPVDLAIERMAPTMEAWRRAITPATRAILVAHLFGSRVDMGPILELARQHGLLVFEDCAQAFAGASYPGHPQADASMFSFGVIKSSTALGGAILRVRDRQVLDKMRQMQATYPVQSRWYYLKRLIKYSAFKLLTWRWVSGLFARACRAMGYDYDRWVNGAARGFPGDDFFRQIRQQPCAALLAVLGRRLRSYDARRWAAHSAKGKELTRLLEPNILCPGAGVTPHTYWVFPILTDSPERLIDELARAGFDATQGQSMCVVQPPADRAALKAQAAERLLANMLYLPFYPELTPGEARRMADVVLSKTRRKEALAEVPAPVPKRSSSACPT
jgi:perosamine synthetase